MSVAIVNWKRRPTNCRRMPRAIWTLFVVSETRMAPSHGNLTSDHRVIALTASQMRIAETVDAFYGDTGVKDNVSKAYKQAVEDLDGETIKALDGPYRYG